jgi:hypothetical protein
VPGLHTVTLSALTVPLLIAEGNLILKRNVIRLASSAKINKKAAHYPDWR